MIYVTHDQIEAMTMADKIVVLQAGRVEQVGSPLELYHHPANLFVAGFHRFAADEPAAGAGGRAPTARATVALPSGQRIAVPVEAGAARPGDAGHARDSARGPAHRRRTARSPARCRLVERLGGLTLLHVHRPRVIRKMTVQIEGSDATRAARADPARGRSGPHAICSTRAGQALPHLGRHPLAA